MVTGSWARHIVPLALVLLVGTAAAGQDTVDLYGVTSTRVGWTPAAGPVVGYYVIAIHNTQDPKVHTVTDDTQVDIAAEIGDEVVVHVAAFDAAGVAGPLSPPSPTIRFHPAATTGTDPPADEEPPPGGEPLPDEPPAGAFAVAYDFGGDGVSDLLLRDGSGALTLWEMNGSAVLAAAALPAMSFDWDVVGAGDYDGNGTADLLWEERASGRLVVWLMDGGGVQEGAPLDLVGLDPAGEWTVGGSADFDGDGRSDVLLQSRLFGEVAFLRMDGSRIAETIRLGGYEASWQLAAARDLDGDGAAEIVWHDAARDRLRLWRLAAWSVVDASFLTGRMPGFRVVGSADFDGDGQPDLFAHDPTTGAVRIWRLDGGAFVDELALPDRDPAVALPVAVADYDGDRRGDLLFVGGDGALEIWFSDGAGVAVHAVDPNGFGGGGEVVVADGTDDTAVRDKLCDGDFDGDGSISLRDYALMQQCFLDPDGAHCGDADMDGDGQVTQTDLEIFKGVFGGPVCAGER